VRPTDFPPTGGIWEGMRTGFLIRFFEKFAATKILHIDLL